MKIAFDYQIFSQQAYGGISRYYQNLAIELLQLEQEVSIFAGLHCNNYLTSLPGDIINGYKLSKYPPKTGKLFQFANHYFTDYQMKSWRPQIIHETYFSNFTPSWQGPPRIVTVYDMIHELFPHELKKKDAISQRKKNACENADHIISISNNTKKDLVECFGVSPEKITVIHLAANTYPKHNLNLIKFNLIKPFLLYVGTRKGYKNFNQLLRALSKSQKLINDFDIVAFGGGTFTLDETNLINSLGFKEDQVKQIGGNDSLLVSLYKEATAFVYPSLYEGFGIPPLEAMAYECPVISSNTSSLPEVVGEAGEYFNPEEIESIKLSIENVVYSPSRIMDLKLKGLERVDNFSWKKCSQETLKVYMKLIT